MKFIRLIFFVLSLSFLVNGQNKEDDINFIDIYYVNKKHQRIITFKPNEKIYLVIESSNGIDKEVTVEMDKIDPDVIYKKRYLTEGAVFYMVLKKNKQLIKFVVFDPKNKKHQKRKGEVVID